MSGQNTHTHPAFTKKDANAVVLPFGVYAIAFLAMLPLAALIYQASGDSQDVWPHLISYVLPSSTVTTLALLAGVACGTFAIGAATAWLTCRYRFPLSNIFQWALVLPLATPTYVAAYTWVEFSDFTGPVQQLVRDLGGYKSSTEYWFPELRSTSGAVFLLSMVLFPYVYLPARLSFQSLGTSMLDVARVLGAGPARLFLRVALPAARPAIAIGVILALMETLNDIGAVEHLGVRTLTFSVFDTWLNRSSLAGAAQLSLTLTRVPLTNDGSEDDGLKIGFVIFDELKERQKARYRQKKKKLHVDLTQPFALPKSSARRTSTRKSTAKKTAAKKATKK